MGKNKFIARFVLITMPIKIGFVILFLLFSCNQTSTNGDIHAVFAKTETKPVPQQANVDAADDPAIWIHPNNPNKSFIIATDKKGGLVTYNLEGEELNYYPHGNMNNCDLRYGFVLGLDTIDVLAASNRSTNTISLYKISGYGKLDTLNLNINIPKMNQEVYGLCMYKNNQSGDIYVFVNNKEGEIKQMKLVASENKIGAQFVRNIKLETQTEGMVADDYTGTLYVSEEKTGIWKFDADETGSSTGTLIPYSSEKNQNIKFDLEGLTIYDSGNGKGYLIASSQGNNSYAVFLRQGQNKYVGSFKIDERDTDGVESTDGLDVTSCDLPGFKKGFLIVQDGKNYKGGELLSQNFKIIPWEQIEEIIRKN